MRKCMSYCRVSTAKQGRSGLGLEAQRAAIAEYVRSGDWKIIDEYIEVETGKHDDRPKLREALHRAKMTGGALVIAKLDRLSRNVRFIAELQESRARFIACDMPDANELTIHIFAALAQWERKAISERTRKALQAIKARGKRLGNPNGARALRRARRGNTAAVAKIVADADRYAVDVLPIIQDIQRQGLVTLEAIAGELNERGILTRRGGRWWPGSVKNLLARA
jgi:DNA invertase Pin-like site-specific DNA recombinase